MDEQLLRFFERLEAKLDALRQEMTAFVRDYAPRAETNERFQRAEGRLAELEKGGWKVVQIIVAALISGAIALVVAHLK